MKQRITKGTTIAYSFLAGILIIALGASFHLLFHHRADSETDGAKYTDNSIQDEYGMPVPIPKPANNTPAPDPADHGDEADEAEPEDEKPEEPADLPQEPEDRTKRIAITFDDGPHKLYTPAVLELLKKYNAKATFFVLGIQANMYGDILKQITEDGHEIGNHTWDHKDLTRLDPHLIKKQIEKTQQVIKKSSGVEAVLVRPPYGAYNNTVLESVYAPLVNWSIDTRDWLHKDVDKIMQEMEYQFHDGAIILMHDIYPTSVEALEMILDKYSKEGYRFVTVSELLGFHEAQPVMGKVYRRKP